MTPAIHLDTLYASVAADVAGAVADLARTEPLVADLARPPLHIDRYRALLSPAREDAGPAYAFPAELTGADGVDDVTDERALSPSFPGWLPGEIAEGRAPVVAVVEGGVAVSVCFCARRSSVAAEAGVETLATARRAWCRSIRRRGRTLHRLRWRASSGSSTTRAVGRSPDGRTRRRLLLAGAHAQQSRPDIS